MGGWVGGWVGGWMDGCKSRVKDCLQQSKIFRKLIYLQWNAEIRTKWSPIPRRSDFGRSVRSIVRFELLSTLMYRTEQKLFGLDHWFGFQTQIFVWNLNKNVLMFLFQTIWCLNQYCYLTKVVCPKSELVQISAFHCIVDSGP